VAAAWSSFPRRLPSSATCPALHGTYSIVPPRNRPALTLIVKPPGGAEDRRRGLVSHFDSPVSNSGRLKGVIDGIRRAALGIASLSWL